MGTHALFVYLMAVFLQDKVVWFSVVIKDFTELAMHQWAQRAAVMTTCVGEIMKREEHRVKMCSFDILKQFGMPFEPNCQKSIYVGIQVHMLQLKCFSGAPVVTHQLLHLSRVSLKSTPFSLLL